MDDPVFRALVVRSQLVCLKTFYGDLRCVFVCLRVCCAICATPKFRFAVCAGCFSGCHTGYTQWFNIHPCGPATFHFFRSLNTERSAAPAYFSATIHIFPLRSVRRYAQLTLFNLFIRFLCSALFLFNRDVFVYISWAHMRCTMRPQVKHAGAVGVRLHFSVCGACIKLHMHTVAMRPLCCSWMTSRVRKTPHSGWSRAIR